VFEHIEVFSKVARAPTGLNQGLQKRNSCQVTNFSLLSSIKGSRFLLNVFFTGARLDPWLQKNGRKPRLKPCLFDPVFAKGERSELLENVFSKVSHAHPPCLTTAQCDDSRTTRNGQCLAPREMKTTRKSRLLQFDAGNQAGSFVCFSRDVQLMAVVSFVLGA
jgi:hypothetical protein